MMIIDSLKNANFYKTLDPRISSGLELLEKNDFSAVRPGRYKVDDTLSYLVQEFDTTPVDHERWEYHRHTTDIQFILSGQEGFGFTNVFNLGKETVPYDPEDDIGYCHGQGNFVQLYPGMFAIQFPHDAHLADHHTTEPSHVKKIVIKIKWNI